jgi:hypothetical protein
MPESEEEVGRIVLDDTIDLVLRKVKSEGKVNIDIRLFLKTDKWKGFTPKGIFFPVERKDEIIKILEKV